MKKFTTPVLLTACAFFLVYSMMAQSRHLAVDGSAPFQHGKFSSTENFIQPDTSMAMSGNTPAPSLKEQVSIYPNPSPDGKIVVNFGQYPPAGSMVVVYNLIGEEMYRKEVGSEVFQNKLAFDLSSLPMGNYFIHIARGNERIARKITINQ